jgi:tetratricopeptide (TPR) repeat protein
MPLMPNQQLSEFRIIRILGQGAFGTIYLAHDTLLDRPVAIKELAFAAQSDEVAFKRFIQEARVAGGLSHPHIVTVYTLKVLDPNVYLVMEYLPGGSLRGLLEQRGPLPVEEAARIAADVCEGLAAAHAKGIVHRDVKPENILIAENGRAKVGDFGIAHVPRHAGGLSLTQTGFQPGTLLYMSPEQIRGEPVDGRSDVYQVGAVLYEMLTGRHYIDLEALERRARETAGSNVMLFQARLFELLSETICSRAPEDIRRIRSDLPVWICQVLSAMLEKPADRRPQAEAAARALRQADLSPLGQSIPSRATGSTPPGIFQSFLGIFRRTGAPPNPEQAGKHFQQAIDHYKRGRLEQAAREFQAALKIRPDYAEAHCGLGAVFFKQGRREEAIREFQAAIQINPNYGEAHYNLGEAYKDNGLLDEAIREFQAALQINPDLTGAHYNLGWIYLQQGHPEKAIPELQTALRANPNNADAHYQLGLAYFAQGHPENAVSEIQAALRINPNLAEAHLELGVIYAMQDRMNDSLHEFQSALRLNPNLAKAHLGLGLIYAEQNRLESAISEFQAALRLNPDDYWAHYELGVVYSNQNRWDEAIFEFQAALRIKPDIAEAYFKAGLAYMNKGDLDKALPSFQAALRIDPNMAEAYYNIGVIYGLQDRLDEAISNYEMALLINPRLVQARHNLGIDYWRQGRADDAVQEWTIAAGMGFKPSIEMLVTLKALAESLDVGEYDEEHDWEDWEDQEEWGEGSEDLEELEDDWEDPEELEEQDDWGPGDVLDELWREYGWDPWEHGD